MQTKIWQEPEAWQNNAVFTLFKKQHFRFMANRPFDSDSLWLSSLISLPGIFTWFALFPERPSEKAHQAPAQALETCAYSSSPRCAKSAWLPIYYL
ncbi:MAG: hypothetical protein IJ664_02860 [Clostridia bacterium]|nr:hypothetical protein [Clostridia bacterium]